MIYIGVVRKSTANFGGIAKQVINTCAGINMSSNFKAYLITDNANSMLANEARNNNISVLVTNLDLKLSSIIKLNRLITNNDIKIIQTHMFKEYVLVGILRKFNSKFVLFYRIHTYINRAYVSARKKKIYHLIVRFLDKGTAKYIPINDFVKNELIDFTHIDQSKIEIVSDGVKSIGVPLKYNKWPNYSIALVGNPSEVKRIDVLINATAKLLEIGIPVKVHIIGGENHGMNGSQNDYTVKLINFAKEKKVYDNFIFHGFISDIYPILKNMDIIILTSENEGTPNSLLEGMSIKKIIVSSNVGGVPEFVKHKKNGFLFANGNYVELAYLIKEIYDMSIDEIATISDNGYKTWRTDYSDEIMIEKLICIYKRQLYDQ